VFLMAARNAAGRLTYETDQPDFMLQMSTGGKVGAGGLLLTYPACQSPGHDLSPIPHSPKIGAALQLFATGLGVMGLFG